MIETRASIVLIVLSAAACGGDPSPSPSATAPPNSTVIAITAAGVNPKHVTIPAGTRVTFVNNDTRVHQMNSDPHPTHGDCPELDAVGSLRPGESRTGSNMNDVGVCGFHDHQFPNNDSLRGTVTIQ